MPEVLVITRFHIWRKADLPKNLTAMGRIDNRYSAHFRTLKLASFHIARVCQRQLAFLVLI